MPHTPAHRPTCRSRPLPGSPHWPSAAAPQRAAAGHADHGGRAAASPHPCSRWAGGVHYCAREGECSGRLRRHRSPWQQGKTAGEGLRFVVSTCVAYGSCCWHDAITLSAPHLRPSSDPADPCCAQLMSTATGKGRLATSAARCPYSASGKCVLYLESSRRFTARSTGRASCCHVSTRKLPAAAGKPMQSEVLNMSHVCTKHAAARPGSSCWGLQQAGSAHLVSSLFWLGASCCSGRLCVRQSSTSSRPTTGADSTATGWADTDRPRMMGRALDRWCTAGRNDTAPERKPLVDSALSIMSLIH